jgi:hypothetical protein
VNERVILAVKFTPAGSGSVVRKAVGGFLRYVEHRDLHPTQDHARRKPEVSGLLKYVAYRDSASTRAELFGPTGTLGSAERKAFAAFVGGALDNSKAQLYHGRDGELHDRRRAVYGMIISPERASGLDLRKLTVAAVRRLENDCEAKGLHWIAAIHRNTAHHHVHLVLAGMREDEAAGFTRVDITRQRLAAMKEALGQEISRQRGERTPSRAPAASQPGDLIAFQINRAGRPTNRPRGGLIALVGRPSRPSWHANHRVGSVIALRAVARRYQRQMQRELEEGYRQKHWELVA